MKPTIAQLAAALIAVFEGPEKLVAFLDTGGVATIGRGHTAGVHLGQTCTHEQAVAWFEADQAPLLSMVEGQPLFAGAAYVDFGYNCGHGALDAVLKNEGSIADPKHTIDRHGVVQPGLVSRRALELLMIAGDAAR